MYVLIRPPNSRHSEPRNSHIASLLLDSPVVPSIAGHRSAVCSGMSVRPVRSSPVSTAGASPGSGTPPIGISSIVSTMPLLVSGRSVPRSGAPSPGVFSSGGFGVSRHVVTSSVLGSSSGGVGSKSDSGATEGSSAHPKAARIRISTPTTPISRL